MSCPVDTGLRILGYVKAYVVAPPLIYGLTSGPLVDAGLQNPVATGLLIYSRCAQAKGSFGFVGPQENIWSVIDVHDRKPHTIKHATGCNWVLTVVSVVTKFYLTIFNTVVLDGKTIAGGNAYYFPTGGDISAKTFMTKIAEALHEFGGLKSAEIIPYTPEELAKVQYHVIHPSRTELTRVVRSGLSLELWLAILVSLALALSPSDGSRRARQRISWKASESVSRCTPTRRSVSVPTGVSLRSVVGQMAAVLCNV